MAWEQAYLKYRRAAEEMIIVERRYGLEIKWRQRKSVSQKALWAPEGYQGIMLIMYLRGKP